MSEKKPLLNRMLDDKLNGPPEWENAAEKVQFVTLRVAVADGTVWAVNILGKPLRPLGAVAGARAEITDPVTGRASEASAPKSHRPSMNRGARSSTGLPSARCPPPVPASLLKAMTCWSASFASDKLSIVLVATTSSLSEQHAQDRSLAFH